MRTESDLHEYQLRAIEHIITHSHSAALMDMGLGKTITTLTAIKRLMYEELDIAKVLIVAPKRVAENVWSAEVREWAHLEGIRVSVVSGDVKARRTALSKEAEVYTIGRDNVEWLRKHYEGGTVPFDMLVVDESSSFKNPKSIRFKALKRLQPFFKRVVLLSGTPTPNSLMDLWPQMYLLDRGERLGKTITAYREIYFKPDKINGHIVYSYKLREGAEERIHSKVGDICMSMKAKDYLSLPPRIDNVVKVQLSTKERKEYEDLERELLLEVDEAEITAMSAATLTLKLQQYANGALYDEEGETHVVHDAKLEALDELIEGGGGRSVLIAWTFKSDRDRIMQRLGAKRDRSGKGWVRGGKVRELHDGSDIDAWNRGEVEVLLMHPASGGHGLNLQKGGNTIVWFGQTWSLELYQQFNARLDRQGQTESVIVHHIVTDGTVDEDIVKRLESKEVSQDAFIEAVKARRAKYL